MQGLIVSRQIGEWLNSQGGFYDTILAPVWLFIETIANTIDNTLVITNALLGLWSHKDLFNLSLCLGIVFKIVF